VSCSGVVLLACMYTTNLGQHAFMLAVLCGMLHGRLGTNSIASLWRPYLDLAAEPKLHNCMCCCAGWCVPQQAE
jgi:hypothetical protein